MESTVCYKDSKASAMDKLFAKYYSDSRYNGTMQFWNLIRSKHGQGRILEIGAGPSNRTSEFLSQIGELAAIDIDESVLHNKYADESAVYDGVKIPFADNSFETVVSDYVFEHVEKPSELIAEIKRVIKSGGYFLVRTPNLYHYVSIGAKLLPDSLHGSLVLKLQKSIRRHEDIYKTYHRFNSPGRCSRLLSKNGFTNIEKVMLECEPSYGYGSPVLFYPMMVVERILNSSSLFAGLRANILIAAQA